MLLTLKKCDFNLGNGNINGGGCSCRLKKMEKGERNIKSNEKFFDINFFYYFNEVFDFN